MDGKPLFELYIDRDDMDFYSEARCRGTDPESFFVEQRETPYEQAVMRVCDSCAVKKECLRFALKYKMLGYWGGTTENQRRSMRRHNLTV